MSDIDRIAEKYYSIFIDNQNLESVDDLIRAALIEYATERRLTKPARVGAVVFHAGVKESLVIDCAQRAHEYVNEPPLSQENVEELRKQIMREPLLKLIEQMEFGSYQRVGGREGYMCPKCYSFRREGHKKDCALGREVDAIRNKGPTERSCTCHPGDSPPIPCQKRYALNECLDAYVGGQE